MASWALPLIALGTQLSEPQLYHPDLFYTASSKEGISARRKLQNERTRCKAAHPALSPPASTTAPLTPRIAIFLLSFNDTSSYGVDEKDAHEFFFGGDSGKLINAWSNGCLSPLVDYFHVDLGLPQKDATGKCSITHNSDLSNFPLKVDFSTLGAGVSWPSSYFGSVLLVLRKECTTSGVAGLMTANINGQAQQFKGIFGSDRAWENLYQNIDGAEDKVTANGVSSGVHQVVN